MKRLMITALLTLLHISLSAQDAVSIKQDPSFIWAEESIGTSALNALVSKLSTLDTGVPSGMWPSYASAIQSASRLLVLPDGRQMRYMPRGDVPRLISDRRHKVEELLRYASSERSADVARTYLGWAESYIQSLPPSPGLQQEAATLRRRLGNGPEATVKMRNVESEIKLIRKSIPAPVKKVRQAEPEEEEAAPAQRVEALEPVGAVLRTELEMDRNTVLVKASEQPDVIVNSAKASAIWYIIPGVTINPQVSCGLSAGVRPGVLGGYVSAFCGFGAKPSEYICRSDGTTSFGRIWTSGESSSSSITASAGLLAGLGKHVCLNLGAGYGESDTYWQDTMGRWSKVEDLSLQGVSAEIGCIVKLGRVALAAGASTIAFRTLGARVGVGIVIE
ncbi:MAG: hypothetical protein J5533_05585 [Bacteroidales bacterium]|nr:hypothetical protein [Bacteroidales bacterium]